MTWSHTNTLTLNPTAERRLSYETDLQMQQLMVDHSRSSLIGYKLDLAKAKDQWERIEQARSQPTSWKIHQLTCGHPELTHFINESLENYYTVNQETWLRELRTVRRATELYGDELERLNRIKSKLSLIRDQADIVVSKDMLDTFLRDNAHYTPGSLQLSFNPEPRQYRVTFSLCDIIATNPRGNNPIVIPPLRIDFYIHPNGEHDLVVRNDISRPYWADRYKGYSEVPLLHPHMTSETTLCLGDFGEGVTEAISEGDFVTAITILTMFFQQYDHDDSAGAYHDVWPDADEDRHIADYADA